MEEALLQVADRLEAPKGTEQKLRDRLEALKTAKQELHNRLARGELSAFAMRYRIQKPGLSYWRDLGRMNIPAQFWSRVSTDDIDWYDSTAWAFMEDKDINLDADAKYWAEGILIQAADIVRLWPMANDPLDAAATPGNVKPFGGRPRGTGLVRADAPLVEKMQRLIKMEQAGSPTQAAWAVVSEAQGGGTLESKVRRLVGRYKEIAGLTENNGE